MAAHAQDEIGPPGDAHAFAHALACAGLAGLPDRLRLPLPVDAAALAADLDRLDADDADWIAHFVPQHYRGSWEILPLRHPRGAVHPILRAAPNPGITDYEDGAALARCPAFAALLATLRCPTGAARLMRLRAGAEILTHRDHDLDAALGQARLHVPVVTGPAASFHLNDRPVAMRPGELWYLRLSDPHRAANVGPADRIHLVIDVTVDRWLAALLRAAATDADAIGRGARLPSAAFSGIGPDRD